jgi:hypothetical protein
MNQNEVKSLKASLFEKFSEEIIAYITNKDECLEDENLQPVNEDIGKNFVNNNTSKIDSFVEQMINDYLEDEALDDLHHPMDDWFREYVYADEDFVNSMNAL